MTPVKRCECSHLYSDHKDSLGACLLCAQYARTDVCKRAKPHKVEGQDSLRQWVARCAKDGALLDEMRADQLNWDNAFLTARQDRDVRIETHTTGSGRVKTTDYSTGEESPYLDWIEAVEDESGNSREAPEANPDTVSDEHLIPIDYITERRVDKSPELKKVNDVARFTLDRNEYRFWQCAKDHPLESWDRIGARLGIEERQGQRLLDGIRTKMKGALGLKEGQRFTLDSGESLGSEND